MKPTHQRQAYANLTMSVFSNTVNHIKNPKKLLGSDAPPSRQIRWLGNVVKWTWDNNIWFDMADALELCSTAKLRERIRELAFDKIKELEKTKSNLWN
jgi:hypothetical protein